jgi:hypothetical protein
MFLSKVMIESILKKYTIRRSNNFRTPCKRWSAYLSLFLFIFKRGEGCSAHNRSYSQITGAFCACPTPGNSTCSRLRKPNLDAPGPTLLNLQDRTVRQRTERTILPHTSPENKGSLCFFGNSDLIRAILAS